MANLLKSKNVPEHGIYENMGDFHQISFWSNKNPICTCCQKSHNIENIMCQKSHNIKDECKEFIGKFQQIKCFICQQFNSSGIMIENFEFDTIREELILMVMCKECLQSNIKNISKQIHIGCKSKYVAIKYISKSINKCLCCKMANINGLTYVHNSNDFFNNNSADYLNSFLKSDCQEDYLHQTILCSECIFRYAEKLKKKMKILMNQYKLGFFVHK